MRHGAASAGAIVDAVATIATPELSAATRRSRGLSSGRISRCVVDARRAPGFAAPRCRPVRMSLLMPSARLLSPRLRAVASRCAESEQRRTAADTISTRTPNAPSRKRRPAVLAPPSRARADGPRRSRSRSPPSTSADASTCDHACAALQESPPARYRPRRPPRARRVLRATAPRPPAEQRVLSSSAGTIATRSGFPRERAASKRTTRTRARPRESSGPVRIRSARQPPSPPSSPSVVASPGDGGDTTPRRHEDRRLPSPAASPKRPGLRGDHDDHGDEDGAPRSTIRGSGFVGCAISTAGRCARVPSPPRSPTAYRSRPSS